MPANTAASRGHSHGQLGHSCTYAGGEEVEPVAVGDGDEGVHVRASILLSSLESRLEFEAEWIEEVKRRAREIDEGTVETIPADRVLREARDRLK